MPGYQPNASQTVAGRVQIATSADIAAGNTIGTTGAPLVVPANLGGGGGGGGAPTNATYVTLSTNASLTDERVLTGTTNQIAITDGGANNPVTLSTPQDIHTGASPQFAGATIGSLDGIIKGTSGALGTATAGTDYENPLTFSTGLSRSVNTVSVVDNATTQKIIVSKSGTVIGTRKQVNLIEGANVSLTVSDDAVNDKVDVTIASTSSGSSWIETEIDLGTHPVSQAEFTITNALVTPTSKIVALQSGNPGTGRAQGDNNWDAFSYSALAGTGNFVLYAMCLTGTAVGARKVYYSIA